MPKQMTSKELTVRASGAWALKVSGSTWRQVAGAMGYPSATAAAADVRRWRLETIHLEAEETKLERMQEEVERLDNMQKSLWTDALQGDIRSIETVLKIIALRARLTGLEEQVSDIQQTVVVTGDQYLSTLRSVVEDD